MTNGSLPGGRTAGSGRTPMRRSRRRGLMRLAVLLVLIVAVVVTVVVVATTGRAVVPVVSEQIYPIHYKEGIARVAKRYGLDPYLVAAVVNTESGYDPAAVSSAGAVGLMQVMPSTAEWVTGLRSWRGGQSPDLNDPDDNLELGACYLGYLLEIFEGTVRVALAAYNAGQGVVGEWVKAAGGTDSFGPSDIVYSETRAFVERVEHYRDLYRRIHPETFFD